jgi:hypothetical protein
MWIAGDRYDTKIAKLDESLASQYGESIDSYFYSPLVPIESASVDWVELNTVSGFVAEDTNLFISTTRDGAAYSQEFSSELAVPLDYELRYIPRRLGYVKKKIGFRFRANHKEKINASGFMVSYG